MKRAWVPALIGVVLVIGMMRIAATYRVFSQTWDEPAHLAVGLEWLQRGTYSFEPLHPPLARVMTAIGPYLAGARLEPDDPNPWSQANRILGVGTAYERMLALARAGVLPFFILAVVGTYLLGRRAGGEWVGVTAAILFSTLPPVLAHAGLATTDLALTAGIVLSLVTLLWWRDQPTTGRGAVLGGVLGATVLTKFSSLLFLPAVILSPLIARAVTKRGAIEPRPAVDVRALRPIWLTALVVIWAGYRFAIGPLLPPGEARACTDRPPPCAEAEGITSRVAELPVYPAPGLVRGLVAYAQQGRAGRKAYFMGERGWDGSWFFFPVVIALKTPIPFLLLAAIGLAATIAARARPGGRVGLAAALAALGIVLVLLPSRVNIGLRHALPIYPLLAVTAACGAGELWRRGRGPAGALLACALVGWQVVASVRAAPDYLPYFNEFAAGPPERYVVDSDLDWGQDLKRMADTLRTRGIGKVALAYNGSADPHAVGIDYRILRPFAPDTGWIAISVFTQKLGYWNEPTTDDFAWLDRFQPVARAGQSMLLYRIDPAR